jgi:hypothetical protein
LLRRFPQFDVFRGPQIAAAALLLAFLLQCIWLVHVQVSQTLLMDSDQALRITLGLNQWRGGPIAGTDDSMQSEAATGIPSAARSGHLRVREGYDQDRSPLYYVLAAAPLLLTNLKLFPKPLLPGLVAFPQIFFGMMLGASIWYVARRLYGNNGGYVALGFYCFSPSMIINASSSQSLGEMGAVWGAFGSIFTAIAVAHTLYAPREVVLWNWRRIFLLGLSLALAIGNQFSLVVLLLMILPIMLWVAPIRPRAVIVIWVTAIAVAGVFILAAYCFEPAQFWQGMRHARWADFNKSAFSTVISYRNAARTIFAGSPPMMIGLPVALVTYGAWRKTRYFGNTVPLFLFGIFLLLAFVAPDFPGQGFHIVMLVFLFVFVAGVMADLIATHNALLVRACLWCVMSVSAAGNLWRLFQLV